MSANGDAIEGGGGRQQYTERNWPDLLLSWVELPLPARLSGLITQSTAALGYRRRTSDTGLGMAGMLDEGTGIGRLRYSRETSIPIRISIGFMNGVSGSYTGLFGTGETIDPTGATEQGNDSHSLQLAGTFRVPESWGGGAEDPLRVALNLSRRSRRQCRLPATAGDGAECVPFVDLVTHQLGVTLETVISQLNVGFQMSYNDRKSLMGLQPGSSQFQIGLFGEFDFEAGSLMRGVR